MIARHSRIPVQADHEHVSRISTTTTLFIIAAVALTIYELQLMLLPFVLAGIVSYICTPAIDLISTRIRLSRTLAAILVFILLLAFGGLVGLLGAPPLVKELTHVVIDFQSVVDTFTQSLLGDRTVNVLGHSTDAHQLSSTITRTIGDWFANLEVIAILASSAAVGGFGLLLTLILLFFFLVSGPRIVAGLLWLVPPGQRPLIKDHILSNLDPVLRRYFLGIVAVVCFAAAFAYVGLGLILGVPHAAFLALITGVLEAIPIVGPFAAASIAGLLALQHNSGIAAIIGYAIYLTALRLSIDQLFGPLVLGAAGRVHPTLIIFCFLAGGTLFGVVGVIAAVPTALIIKATLAVLYDQPPSEVSGTGG